jgi:uncharacterized protein (TIGR03000 family)
MLRRWLPAGSVLAAAAAVLLLLPETSSAQWFGGRGGIGYNTGRFGVYFGSGSPYYSGFYPGYASGYYGWNSPYYGSTWVPRYYGSYSNYAPGFTRWYGPRYSASYDWSTPSYYSSSYPSGTMGSFYATDMSSQGYYGTPTGDMRPDRTVLINLRVPPEAEIWFDDAKTQSTGMFRDFISPPLQPGQDYTYQVRARWMENGQEVTKNRELRVRAGDQLNLDFLGESASAFPSDQPGRGPAIDRNIERMPKYGTEQNLNRTTPSTETTPRTTPLDPGTSTPPKPNPPEDNPR